MCLSVPICFASWEVFVLLSRFAFIMVMLTVSRVITIVLHLDNDRDGRLATKTIQQNLTQYHVRDSPPKYGKDVNDDLKTRLGIEKYPRNPCQKRIQTR